MPTRPGRYLLMTRTGRALEADAGAYWLDGARVQTWKRYDGLNQTWEISPAQDGLVYLANVAGQRVLAPAADTVDHDGSPLQLRTMERGSRSQMWELLDVADGRYGLRCAASSGTRVLSLAGNEIDRSAGAELRDYFDLAGQDWELVPASNDAVVTADAVDLRPNQTPIKDQGDFRGSCTYFGWTAVLEAAYKRAGYGDVNLSEEFWSIMAKAMWLHPWWDQVTHANYTENQMAGTQGGGSGRWYTNGFRIPTEADAPYRPVDYTPPNWETKDQRAANDFNFSLFSRPVLNAPNYYGAAQHFTMSNEERADPQAYERVLGRGSEIVVDLAGRVYGGAHNVAIVGFDRAAPGGPAFYVKNSWGPAGADPREECDIIKYEELLPDVVSTAYISDVRKPGPWPELAFLGRWHLNFDGHKGLLDIYHIPGVSVLDEFHPDVPDRRIGVFYDSANRAHRVNGSISGHKIEFRFSGEKPNLRWDDLSGRHFVYYLSPQRQVMAGFHTDEPGQVEYPGLATRGSPIRHGVPTTRGFDALASQRWTMIVGSQQGTARFGRGTADSVRGRLRFVGGETRAIEANRRADGRMAFWIEGLPDVAIGRALNHAPGIIAGHTSAAEPFYAAMVPRGAAVTD